MKFSQKIKIDGVRQSSLSMARSRLVLLSSVIVLAYIFVLARVVDLGLIQGELKHRQDAYYSTMHVHADVLQKRADIVDRNGVLLARSLRTASLYADPQVITQPMKVAEDLVVAFPELQYGHVLQKLQSNKRFVWLKRNLTPDEQYKILYLGHPGLEFQYENKRIYPHGSLVSHIVGYTSQDGSGLSSVEKSFEDFLNASDKGLMLTIDVRLQHALHREISDAVKKHNALGGSGVVMDVHTGEVLAAVSLPDFDPHFPGEAEQNQLFNKATLGVYELGSTFKIFSTAALLDTHNVKMSKMFDVREPLKVGRHTISDFHPEERLLSVPEVFMHSSNIGSAMMGQMVGNDTLKSFYQDLGLLQPVQFEISEAGTPLIPEIWRDINTLTASYGHGIAVSPLHLITAVSSVVNGGIKITPTLVQRHPEFPGKGQKPQLRHEMRIVSPQTSEKIRKMMRLVVEKGTGQKADVPGFLVGGKTGTAEKVGQSGYDKTRLISSFIGVFPSDNPLYAVYIMVDEPKGIPETAGFATGGWVAAPAVGNVIASMASILGIKPVGPDNDFSQDLHRYIVDTKKENVEDMVVAH